jgi:hypothetical protein
MTNLQLTWRETIAKFLPKPGYRQARCGKRKRKAKMKRIGIKRLIAVLVMILVLLGTLTGQALAQTRPGAPETRDPEVIRECINRAFEELIANPSVLEGGRFALAVADCVAPIFPPE